MIYMTKIILLIFHLGVYNTQKLTSYGYRSSGWLQLQEVLKGLVKQ